MDATRPTRQRRRLLRDERGSILVEFALIGPMFMTLILCIIELGVMLFAQTALDGAARAAARTIRTGQVQATGNPQAAFSAALCAGLGSFIPCSSVIFDVEVFPTFGAITTPRNNNSGQFTDAAGNQIPGQFVPGNPGQIVVVKVIYQRQFISGYARQYLGFSSQGGSGGAVLSSTVVFQNEPP